MAGAFEIPLFTPGIFEANADLSGYQFALVAAVTNAPSAGASVRVKQTTAVGQAAIGVLQDKPAAAGRSAGVMCFGISRVLCKPSGANPVKVMSKLCSGTSGRTRLSTGAGVAYVVGLALQAQASGTSGTIAVFLNHLGRSTV